MKEVNENENWFGIVERPIETLCTPVVGNLMFVCKLTTITDTHTQNKEYTVHGHVDNACLIKYKADGHSRLF